MAVGKTTAELHILELKLCQKHSPLVPSRTLQYTKDIFKIYETIYYETRYNQVNSRECDDTKNKKL